MANINFSSLTEDGKVAFFLGLSEKVLSVFSQKEDQILAQEVIYKCWEWLKGKENIGDILYELLDNEENGITIIQEMSDNETDVIVWNCVIDAVAYTSRKAFEREGVKYYPEPIALVDDTLVDHFMNCFERCIENSNSYIRRIISLLDENKKGNIASDLRTEVLRELQIQN
ncbi:MULTISPECIES: Imm6 family immunity protein [Bacillus]|uniref:Imm6 family immunity protein n=1 Tax=Bacillus TaxID=1386 RepID=UPI0003154890|nr:MULTISPECIES: Imm6 family immunity protein [Bacillus]